MSGHVQRASGRSRATILGGAAVAALLLVNIYLFATPIDTSAIKSLAGPAIRERADDTLATPLDGRSPETFAEIVQRPLFNSSRKPIDRARPRMAEAPQASVAAPPDLRLVGVAKSRTTPGRALLRVADEPVGRWIAEGESVNGWTLRSVRERGVVLEFGGRVHELTLRVPRRAAEDVQDGSTDKPR
jgi:hypothetical protein